MKRAFNTIIFILIITTFWRCAPESKNDASNTSIFRYNESQGITSLDPAYARNVENIWVVNHLFNGLVQMDDELNIKRCIAKDWDISEDGLTYTFFLRKDVHFHPHNAFPNDKGRKVTAKDFVFSYLRLMDPKTASPGSWIFSNIDKSNPQHLGFEALDKYTLRIHLKSAFQPFLGLLTMKYCSVVPHEVVEIYGDDFRNNPIGTGPFRFQFWKEGNKLVLLKNENYFEKDHLGTSLPYLDAVNVSFIGDEEVEYLEFLKGNIDFLSGSNSSNLELLKEEGGLNEQYQNRFTMMTNPYLNTEYLGILMDSTLPAMKRSPLNYKFIRKAINLGFNRKDMIKYLKNNVGKPAEEGFIPKGMKPFKEGWVKGYTYDPDSARKLLELSGFPNGAGMPKIILSTTAQYLTLCEYIQSQLSEIGLNVEIEMNPAATNREEVALSRIPFFRKSWIADYPDAENYLALFYSQNFAPSGPNYTHFKNKTYDDLYEASRVELDEVKRFEMYKQMEEILIEESPIVPLYYDQVVRYVQNDIEGLTSNPMNLLDLRRVKK